MDPLFIYKGDIAPGTDSLEKLTEAQKSIDASIKPKLSDLFQRVHERRAQLGSVDQSHEKWQEEARKVRILFSQTKELYLTQYPHIPVQKDLEKVARAISMMFDLEMLSHPLTHTCDELDLILQSTLYRNTLTFFKAKVKACETGKDLTALVHASLKHISETDFQRLVIFEI